MQQTEDWPVQCPAPASCLQVTALEYSSKELLLLFLEQQVLSLAISETLYITCLRSYIYASHLSLP